MLAQTCSSIGKDSNKIAKVPALLRVDSSNDLGNTFRKSSLSAYSNFSQIRHPTKNGKQEASPMGMCSSPMSKFSTGSSPLQSSSSGLSQTKLSNSRKRRLTATSPLENGEWKQSRLDCLHSVSAPLRSNYSAVSSLPVGVNATRRNESFPSVQSSSPSHNLLSLCDASCTGYRETQKRLSSLDAIKSTPLPLFPFTTSVATYPWYAQMLMAATTRSTNLAAEPSAHVCHWFSASTGSCGKRFSTSQELLSHLQTHVMVSADSNRMNYLMSNLEKLSSPYATAYISQQAAALAAASASNLNTVTGDSFLRSHSPNEKYNLFKSNLFTRQPNVSSLPIMAGVGPYYSPYAVYKEKLGTAAINYP